MANPDPLTSETMTEPPETCRGKLCGGEYMPEPSMESIWDPCPLDGPACPFHMARLLRPIGFGERYQSVSIERIANEGARTAVQAYIDSIADAVVAGKGLYIQGGVGAGKTSILALVAYAAASAGYSVAYWYAGELFDRLHRDDQEAVAWARECDILLLDDFGTQYAIDWTLTRFDALVEFRYAHGKVMCVTTNVDRADLKGSDAWGRVYDRWREMCEGISAGKDSMR